MAMHWNSMSASASARAPRAAAHPVLNAARHGIGFDLQDVALEQVLRAAVRGRHDLYEAGPDEAALTITDRAPDENGFGAERRMLRVGVEQGGRNTLDSLDPSLILAAASLIAAGYTLDRERQGELRSAARPLAAAQPARAPGRRPAGRRGVEQGDRAGPRYLGAHGEVPRHRHPRKARRPQPRRRGLDHPPRRPGGDLRRGDPPQDVME